MVAPPSTPGAAIRAAELTELYLSTAPQRIFKLALVNLPIP